MDEDDTLQNKATKGKHNDGAADLEKVTDYVEEQEISTSDIQKVRSILSLYTFFLHRTTPP